MTAELLLLVVGAGVGWAVVAVVWPRLQRRRWRRRLADAEREVTAAVSDGRLAPTAGEALLQHLEGLRRACSHRRGEP